MALTAITAFLLLATVSRAADESAKPALFLPKSPAAAAYILGRLSDKELIEAPRSEFVYVALLQRPGIDRKYRIEAMDGLAKVRSTDALTELLGGIAEVDKKADEAEPVLRELAALLLQTKLVDLASRQAALQKLADGAESPLGRQIGYAGVMTADGSAEKSWARAAGDAAHLADLLRAVPLLRDAAMRAALYPKIEPLLHQADRAEVRRAAVTAIAAVPGHDSETFATLAALVKAGTEPAAAVASLRRLPRKGWPADQVEPLLESLIALLQKIPVEQRTEPDGVNAFQFASDLAGLLPANKAAAAGKTLRGLGVSIFVLRTIHEQMLYDKSLIVVEAGKPVEIVLINEDSMPHNVVVVAPGALEEIGQAAEKMPLEADAQGRLYVPDSPKVLQGTKMVEAGQQIRLSFTAPEEPGDYQYVCTFPGHWRRMTGTLAVVTDVEAYLASHPVAEPVMTEWKIGDLIPDLERAAMGRNLAVGKDLFIRLACAQCHKLGAEGNNFGPELTDLFKRYQNSRAEVLRQILEPSLVIADRYRPVQFELKNGDPLSGMIVKEDADTVTVQSGPSEALIKPIRKSEITERLPQKSSLMPMGLLNSLSKEQIYDLLAYLEAGGLVSPHEHGK